MMLGNSKKASSVTKEFEKFLKSLNCTYQRIVEKDTKATQYFFEFQGGHFVGHVRDANDGIEVSFPCMASVKIDELELVRYKCNEHNRNNMLFKFYYSADHEKNEVDVHLSFYNNTVQAEALQQELSACFYFQREWLKDYDEAAELRKSREVEDLESTFYRMRHELFLVRQLEMSQQSIAPNSIQEHIRLGELMSRIANWSQQTQLDKLIIIGRADGQEIIDNKEEISQFDICHALLSGKGRQLKVAFPYATLTLLYTDPTVGDHQQLATIALTSEGDDGNICYTRATITLPVSNHSRINSISKHETSSPQTFSLLLGAYRTTSKQRQQEFDYMWKDALLKKKNGESSKLDKDQQLLVAVQDANIGYNIYWGKRLMQQKRYAEAIRHLENAFYGWRDQFFDLGDDAQNTILEIAYSIGVCYMALKMYPQAYYYIDIVAGDGNIRHASAYISILVNTTDLRSFNEIDNIMDDVRKRWNPENAPENITDFVNFLRQARAQALINFNKLDEAEKILTEMLDEEEQADFAIKRLAYIKKLRQEPNKSTEE